MSRSPSWQKQSQSLRVHSQAGGLGWGVLQISSGGDDRRIFLGLKFLIPGFFWVGLGSIFLGGLTLLRIFLGINSNNLNICGSANVSQKLRLRNLA